MTRKQQKFVEEYLKDLNGTQAAIHAGNSAKTAGQMADKLMKREPVRLALQEAQAPHRESAGIEIAKVLREYSLVGFSNIAGYLTFGPDGVEIKDSATIPREVLAAVAEVTETRTKDGGSIRFKLHNKIAALDSICRVLGFNAADRQESQMPPEEIARRLIDLLRLAGPNR